jgi:hypothetical protein
MRMHADEKYRRLTPCPPCGQALWWNLLAGKQTGIIPGLCTIGEAAFAEQLRWPLKGFREAFAEVFREGMAEADWDAHLLWVPNAIRYNPPTSPNVVRSWSDAWLELPECDLKLKAHESMKCFLNSLAKGFREAFDEACPKPCGKAFAKASAKPSPNQEQEQEQEQEPPKAPRKRGVSGATDGFDEFWEAYPRREAKPAAAKAWTKLAPDAALRATIQAAIERQKRHGCLEPRAAADGRSVIPHPATWINQRRWEDDAPPAAIRTGQRTVTDTATATLTNLFGDQPHDQHQGPRAVNAEPVAALGSGDRTVDGQPVLATPR